MAFTLDFTQLVVVWLVGYVLGLLTVLGKLTERRYPPPY
jgi:hypothetical protein